MAAFSLRSLRVLLLVVAAIAIAAARSVADGFEPPQPFLRRSSSSSSSLAMAMASESEFARTRDCTRTAPVSRRSAFSTVAAAATAATAFTAATPDPASAAKPNGLVLNTAPESGLRWADAKIGSGTGLSTGSTCSIDYSMASTAGRFPSIYSTKNGDAPYRWVLGDGSTIGGIELAVLGSESDGIPPMLPGGIRRVIVPSNLGYDALRLERTNKKCVAGSEGSIGPIPPKDAPDGAYQRWYQFYCNPRIPYQPDLVLDIKLYGKRT